MKKEETKACIGENPNTNDSRRYVLLSKNGRVLYRSEDVATVYWYARRHGYDLVEYD